VTFVSNGNGSTITITLGTGSPNTLSGPVVFGTATGNPGYTFSSTATLTGTFVSGNFNLSPATGVSTFTYVDNNGDKFSADVTWTTLSDNSPNPTFHGTLTITSATAGSGALGAEFANLYPKNATVGFDFTMNTLGTTLSNLVLEAAGTTESQTIESGSITPAPEPGTLALFGMALLAVIVFTTRRTFYADAA
jgi:hypothetical protein